LPFAVYWIFPSAQFDSEGVVQAYRGEINGLGHLGDIAFWNSTSLFGCLASALVVKAWVLAGHPTGSLAAIRFFNALCGGLCSLLMFLILLRLSRDKVISLLVSLLFSFSAGPWLVSTNLRTYPLAVLVFLLNFCCLFLMSRGRFRPVLLGVLNSIAYFLHVTGIVFVPVVLADLMIAAEPLGRKVQNLLVYCVSLAVATGAFFYGINAATRKTFPFGFPEFIKFELSNYIMRRLDYQDMSVSFLSGLRKAGELCSSLMSTVVIGNLSWHRLVYDARYLLVVFIVIVALSARRLMAGRLQESVLCLVWFLCSSAAFLLLDPKHPFLFVAAIPLFILLGLSAGILGTSRKWRSATAAVLGLLLLLNFYANFKNRIYPDFLISTNTELSRVLYFRNNISREDCVVASGLSNDAVSFLYFVRCDLIDVANFMGLNPEPEKYGKLVEELLSRSGRRRIFLYTPHLMTSDYSDFALQQGWDVSLVVANLRKNFIFKPFMNCGAGVELIRLVRKSGGETEK
jgi:hypothetical protein